MKKWNKAIALLLVFVMMACVFAGCGKKDKDESKASVTEASESNAADNSENTNDADKTQSGAAEEEAAEAEEIVDTGTPVQKFWGGDWYGIMWITNAAGDYENFKNVCWDAMGTIDVDENGNADMVLWYEDQTFRTKADPVAEVKLTISEDSGSGEMGAAISESGWMFANSDTGNGDINHADWIIDPMTDPFTTKYDNNDLIHIEGQYADGSGGIYYHFFLRKWGTLWEDVAKDPEMLIPEFYEDWYKPLVADGYAMPEYIGAAGSVKMDDISGQMASSGSDSSAQDVADNDTQAAKKTGGSTYDGGELVLVDDEYCKVMVMGMGSHPYNDSWIGYLVELTNKSDFSIYFTSYAEPDLQGQTLDSLGTGNTCYYNGEKCKTHFGETIKAGTSTDKACIVIDGVTDVSQLGNVQGYIVIVNNETGEVLNNIPYSF